MDLFTITGILIALSALFGYINVRFLKLPTTIGLMIIAILFTLGIFVTNLFDDGIYNFASDLINSVDFQHLLLDVMLGFLLFAGAIHTNFDQLKVQRWPILIFSTLGILASTFIIGTSVYYLLALFNIKASYIACLLFGSLISPTDPIAVLGILKQAGVPKKLETKIVGESLFNDGVGVVIFLTILSIAGFGGGEHHAEASISGVIKLFGLEVLGGIAIGGLMGYLTWLLLRSIDDYNIEVTITLALVTAGYSLAHFLGVSGPLAMVVAGLIVGNDTVRDSAMSEITEQYVDKFWELVDMLLNSILFVLIGLELIILSFDSTYIVIGIICILLVLGARFLSLIIPVKAFSKKLDFVPNTTTIMTWGGLRGGISIALALSLPEEMNRELFLTITYIVVVFFHNSTRTYRRKTC